MSESKTKERFLCFYPRNKSREETDALRITVSTLAYMFSSNPDTFVKANVNRLVKLKAELSKASSPTGVVYVGILTNNNTELRIGRSKTHRWDTFIKKKGRNIAYERALKKPISIIPINELKGIHKKFTAACEEIEKDLIFRLNHSEQINTEVVNQ